MLRHSSLSLGKRWVGILILCSAKFWGILSDEYKMQISCGSGSFSYWVHACSQTVHTQPYLNLPNDGHFPQNRHAHSGIAMVNIHTRTPVDCSCKLLMLSIVALLYSPIFSLWYRIQSNNHYELNHAFYATFRVMSKSELWYPPIPKCSYEGWLII